MTGLRAKGEAGPMPLRIVTDHHTPPDGPRGFGIASKASGPIFWRLVCARRFL